MRAQETGCAALLAAHARSVEAEYLVRTGWATEVVAPRDVVRERISVGLTGDSDARPRARPGRPLGPAAQRGARAAARRGAARARCSCRRRASATPPGSPATAAGRRPCAPSATDRCACGARRVRPSAPGAPPRPPAGGAPSAAATGCGRRCSATPAPPRSWAVPCPAYRCAPRPRATGCSRGSTASPAIVVATPGAEPRRRRRVRRGRAAGHLAAAGPLRPARHRGGRTPLGQRRSAGPPRQRRRAGAGGRRPGPPGAAGAASAGTRGGLARREIDERQSAHLPPASRVATITGEPERPRAGAGRARSCPPAPRCSGRCRSRAPRAPTRSRSATSSACRAAAGAALSAALGALQAQRSTRKLPHVRVEVDPAELG